MSPRFHQIKQIVRHFAKKTERRVGRRAFAQIFDRTMKHTQILEPDSVLMRSERNDE